MATPIAYVASRLWLQEFANRIDLGIEPFLIAGGAALLIDFTTISIQSMGTALADPVENASV